MKFRTAAAVLLISAAAVLPSAADPDDEACLTHLSQSLQDPLQNLQNWTRDNFAAACTGFTSFLQGATCNDGRIYKLQLSNLGLRGTISPFLSNCSSLQSLDFSNNALTGTIPTDLQYLVNLAVLNLAGNQLTGDIPPALSACAYLNVIDLHRNSLSGPIPQELGLLARLSTFDVSYNRLCGPIPAALGNRSASSGGRFNLSSFLGNNDLYGFPLGQRGKAMSAVLIVAIGLGSGFASLLLSFTAVCVWLRAMEQRTAGEKGSINEAMPDY